MATSQQRAVLGMVGLGRMGANMVRRLNRHGLVVAGFDADPAAAAALAGNEAFVAADSIEALVARTAAPRCIWIMLPAGEPTEGALARLAGLLQPGDLVIDGGNADYRDSQRRAKWLAERQLLFMDIGVSGGVWGLENGYGLMFGGAPEAVARMMPVVKALAPAPDAGWVHCGPPGSGHYAKMIHNGIEYGLMQAYAEGFSLLAAKKEFDLDLGAIAKAWQRGTVVRSWLLDLSAEALADPEKLAGIAPVVADSGEGRWTVRESVDLGVPAPVITIALAARFTSQGRSDFASRFLARLRNLFGGHAMGAAKHPG